MHTIDVLIVVLEYAVWLLPIAFVLIGIHKIAQKSGETKGLLLTLPALIITTISVTIKEFLVLHTDIFGLYRSFFYGNILILSGYIFLLFSVRNMLKEEEIHIKIPSRFYAYMTILMIFAIYPAFRHNYLLMYDLFAYLSLILITMYVAGALFFLIHRSRKEDIYIISILAIALVIDFLLKGISETNALASINLLKFISFMFRITAELAFIYLIFVRDSVIRKKKRKIKVLHKVEAQFVKNLIIVYLITDVIFMSATYVALLELRKTDNNLRASYSYVLLQDASVSSNTLRGKISNVRSALDTLSMNPSVIYMNETGKNILINFYRIYQDTIASVTRMNEKGIITFTYPYENSIGKDISAQPHIKLLLKTHKAVLSDPIRTVQGFYAIIYHTPVFDKDKFDGSLSVLFSLKTIGKNVVNNSFKNEGTLIVDARGTIIYPYSKEIFLKDIKDVIPTFNGKLPDTFIQSDFGPILAKARKTYLFYDKPYTVIAFLPKSEVVHGIFRSILPFVVVLLIFILSFVAFIMLAMYAYEKRNAETEMIAGKEYEEAEKLSKKLQQTIETFAKADINKNLEMFANELLKSAIRLIDGGEAGSIIIKDGEHYTYVAVEGFDESLIGKYLNKSEMKIGEKEKAHIIPHIYNNTKYTGEMKKNLEKIGTQLIQSTIEAPLIVDGEYFGGIFIDNFESENAFTETDLKIADAISKLGSIYLKNRLLLEAAQDAQIDLSYLISAFSELKISLSEKEFFEKIMQSARELIPQADAGSITLKRNTHFQYVAAFGYSEEIFSIRLDEKTGLHPDEKVAFIMDNLKEYNKQLLDKKTREALSRVGADKIKHSLIAPIIVNDEYVGGIFLDSFKEEKTFTRRELMIANAFSNLGSTFVANKLAFNKLIRSEAFNTTSISLFHLASLEDEEKEIIKVTHNLLTALYPASIEEVAIGEVVGDFIKLVKFDGKIIMQHTFEIAGAIKKAIKEKHSVFTENEPNRGYLFNEIESDKMLRSQVIIFSTAKDVPIFRVRFNKGKKFSPDEKEFFERFGREVALILQSSVLFREIKDAFINYIISIANAISARDPYTRGHSERVAAYATLIAETMKLPKETIRKVALAGILHDVGKIGIPLDVLTKPGRLTKEEFEIVKQHTVRGYEIVEPIDPEIAEIVRAHHERIDGKGYPDGLKDDEIPFEARIITVADVYDALTTDRPYRKAFTHEKTIEIMKSEGSAHFDMEMLNAFLTMPKEMLEETKEHPNMIEKLRKYL